jgi:PAS domain S-box-containing protein
MNAGRSVYLGDANLEEQPLPCVVESPEDEESRDGQRLQDSEKRYRRLFESAQDGILILDADSGKVVDANPFLLQLLGYSYDAMYGQFIWDLGVFKDIAASKDAFKTLQENAYIRYDDLPLETLAGQAIAVEFVSNVYLVDHARVIQCNIRDITERRRTERALAASDAKTRGILDNIGIGVALISPKLEVLEMNRRMRDWFPGVDPAQRPFCYDVFTDPAGAGQCHGCPTHQTLQDGLVHEFTTLTPRPGGARNYRIVSSPILDASGKVTAAIEMVEDLTEKLALEAQVRQAQKMEAVGRLAGGVAHDFNNMLSVILGHAELALDKVAPSEPVRADLEAILGAASRSTQIVRQLLAFARKQPAARTVLDLNDTVEAMLKMLRRMIGEDIHLAWLPASGLWRVNMDPVQVEQILANLCVNARDAIAGVGTLTIETQNAALDKAYCADHAGFVPGEYAVMVVSDDGRGMDEGTVDKIFEPFFTTKEPGQGTGLGLATVYGIVRQNDGFINVYSEQAEGTTFRIYLPRHEGQIVESALGTAPELPRSRGETVLVVEDETSVLGVAHRMLDGLGYTVLTATDPEQARHVVDSYGKEIDLLMTDVILPSMNGKDLAEQLKALKPSMKCLFTSGYTADVIAHRGMLAAGVQFLPKPFSMNEMAAKVRAALDA